MSPAADRPVRRLPSRRRVPRPFSRRVAAVVLAVTCLLAACTATVDGRGIAVLGTSAGPTPTPTGRATPVPAPAPQAPARFFDCKSLFRLSAVHFPAGREARLRFQCALIKVPLDYANPTGRTVTLVILRVHDAADTSPVGQLLVNPGGPGASGVSLAAGLSAQVADTVLAHFDLVGFDPRGVGESTPVNCLSNAQKDRLNAESPNLLTKAGRRTAKAAADVIASACETKYGSALADFNTVNTARDMDQIRQAVGDDRMNYLGFSYGTELGSVYAHLFPTRIRVMVLDGAVDPLTNGITQYADQLQGFEDAFDQFAAWCRRHSPCRSLGPARSATSRLFARAGRSPIPSAKKGETRRATRSLAVTGVLSALYAQSEWPALARALIAGRHGNSAGLLALADEYYERHDGKYTNITDANITISCNDTAVGPTEARILATARSWQRRFPLFGSASAPSLYQCQQWQRERTVPPLPTARSTPRPVLVIGNLHDPATPYRGAVDLARTMGNARLLTWDGEGHTSYLKHSRCVDTYVNTYLVRGTPPPDRTTCPR